MSNQNDTVTESVTVNEDGTVSRTRVATRGIRNTSEGTKVIKEPAQKEPETKKK